MRRDAACIFPRKNNMSKPLILIVNDDGIQSEGIASVVSSVLPLGDVVVAAPHVQQTSTGRAHVPLPDTGIIEKTEITLRDGTKYPAYAVHGTPALCTIFGAANVCERMPDLVISGINYGTNVGATLTNSGTVGAALEASGIGIPAIATSLDTTKEMLFSHGNVSDKDYFTKAAEVTAIWAKKVLDYTLKGVDPGLPEGMDPEWIRLINVNIPQGLIDTNDYCITFADPIKFYEYSGIIGRDISKPYTFDCDMVRDASRYTEGSDLHAVYVLGKVSVTPLSADLTRQVGNRF